MRIKNNYNKKNKKQTNMKITYGFIGKSNYPNVVGYLRK
jgi:hypothetical protein